MKSIKIKPSEFIKIQSEIYFYEKTFYLRPEHIVSVCFDKSDILIKLSSNEALSISFKEEGGRLKPETKNEYYRIKEDLEEILGEKNIPSIDPHDTAKNFPIHLNSKVRSAHHEHLTTIYIDRTDIKKTELVDKGKLVIHFGDDIPITLTSDDESELQKVKDDLDGKSPKDQNTIGAPPVFFA